MYRVRWSHYRFVPLYYAPTSGLITTGSGTADGNFTSANFVDGLEETDDRFSQKDH
ncbi:MAG: hypothetical protein P0116_11480 [Candidatus Nitrosocosmicus sp.]|nr:hypothetical protein [Candidatus Nitrosocosmicus sp.]